MERSKFEGEPDGIDPELRAALDKEVEEFRQRLEATNIQNRSIPKLRLPISSVKLQRVLSF